MIELIKSNDGASLALSINGYKFFQTCGADVLAFEQARFCNGPHAPMGEPDVFRDRLTDETPVWMADTDRGWATAWAFDGGTLAHYIASLPPRTAS